MVKIGMVIGDRYEVLEKIGTGGMSDVYKAKDLKLNRNVAVKVLKQEFSENENFVSKFRVEAQAAAGLMHPNIVNVYDVGEDGDIYYIVMELVEGITLKKYIEKKARLSYMEAVSIAIQVSLGIEAAHNNHIIHRDIKPQNIIISKDGKVKVTDFGIAKAATSNTITSNVMGSVHYTSPEQARGGYSDEKSDIYSLGITMFEMLTGRVPFNGETTVAIAIKHIQEEMPSPRDYVSEIPVSVENIVLKCCEKSPDRRYQNMHELVEDLKRALMNPDEDFVVRSTPVMEGGTRAVTEDEMQAIKSRSSNYGYQEYYEEVPEDSMRLASDTGEINYDEVPDAEEESDYDYDPKMERITTILAIVAGIVIVIIIIVLALQLFGKRGGTGSNTSLSPVIVDDPVEEDNSATPGQEQDPGQSQEQEVTYVSVPKLVGESVDDARNALFALSLNPTVDYEESSTVDSGYVISANFEEGTSVATGTTVNLVVSSGTSGVEMPSVVGLTYDEAYNTLTKLGFSVNKTEEYSDSVASGLVISQSPAESTMVAKAAKVSVTVSLGEEEKKIRVPNLVGMTEADGTISAIENGLIIGSVTEVFSQDYGEGLICSQSLAVGSYVDQDSTIDISVSKGSGIVTYKYNASITAPTAEEAPHYTAGTEVSVKLVTSDGTVLLDTKVSSFPQSANYYGLKSAEGTITMTYTYTTEGTSEVVTGEDGTQTTVTNPGETITESFTRDVTFIQE